MNDELKPFQEAVTASEAALTAAQVAATAANQAVTEAKAKVQADANALIAAVKTRYGLD